jgi:uncharacterized protein YndB with AHSA1/START domain/uncharacterized protein YciI
MGGGAVKNGFDLPPPIKMRHVVMNQTGCFRILLAVALVLMLGRQSEAEGESDMEKTLVVEETIPASVDRVWRAWTTSEGIESFLAEEAEIRLEIGGPYEIYFNMGAPEGQRGSEGCTVLSYLPMEMLSFTWNAPPSIPNLRNAGARTHVVVRFDDINSESTRLQLTQLGFGTGPDWDAYYAYFSKAWPSVLRACKEHFAQTADETESRMEESSSDQKMFLIRLRPNRDTFLDDITEEERAHINEHFEYLKDLHSRGVALMAGRTEDASVGLVLVRTDSEGAAEEIMRNDPAVKAGVFIATMDPFLLALMAGR